MNNILSEIRKRRTQKGFSQDYLGTSIGLDRVRYSLIETGKRELKLEEVYKIATALECDVFDLIAHDTNKQISYNLDLPLKTVEELAEVPYNRAQLENELLRKEIDSLKSQLADKDKIIKLLESQNK